MAVTLQLLPVGMVPRANLCLRPGRRDINQLADDLTNEEFKQFDPELRIALDGKSFKWRILDRLLAHADSFYSELGTQAPDRVPKFGRKIRKLNPC